MGIDDHQVSLQSRAGHLRRRAFCWPVIALSAAAVIATVVISNHRQFSNPGPLARLYGMIGHWAGLAGFDKVQSVLNGRGYEASQRYLDDAITSGRVAVVRFNDEGYIGRGEFSE